MSYPYIMILCLLMMGSIALIMYYLGTKISYSYILYNAAVSIGSGVIFFLFKIIFTMNKYGPIEQVLDIVIMMLLGTVWIFALLETFTVEAMENGREIKGDFMLLVNRLMNIKFKSMSAQIARGINIIPVKIKSLLAKNKLALKIQKTLGELSKNREVNKRV